jgi:exosortase/archaeosortase family protein
VLAYTSSIKSKLMALAAGIPFIFAVNIIRLVALGWVTTHIPQYARMFHDYLWQAGFLFLVIAMWLTWIELVVKLEETAVVPR